MPSFSDSEVLRQRAQTPPLTPRSQRLTQSAKVEDLELSSQSTDRETLSSFTRTTRSGQTDVLAAGDYHIYPGGDVCEFFGDRIPDSVAQICLVNDFYILVKIACPPEAQSKSATPDPDVCCSSSSECRRGGYSRKKIYPIDEVSETSEAETTRSGTTFITDRIRKLNEAGMAAQASRPPTRRSCWAEENISTQQNKEDVEVFPSRTRITLPNQIIEEEDEEEPEVLPSKTVLQQNHLHFEEISLDSRENKVNLNNYGILITPKHASAAPPDKLIMFQLQPESEAPSEQSKSECACFRWMLGMFRKRRRKSHSVNANVFKTYFVNWKKPEETSAAIGAACQCPCQCGRSSKNLLKRHNSAHI